MKLYIQRQEKYSRSELLARTFFGWLYIGIPHGFLIFFYSIYLYLMMFVNFFYVLFTGKFFRPAYDAFAGLQNWQIRLSASLSNLVDGYPPFGPSEKWGKAYVELNYPEKIKRLRFLGIIFFGFILLIPHFIVIYFWGLASSLMSVAVFFIVLFSGKYPESIHNFVVSFYRLNLRVSLYYLSLYKVYPSFNGEENEDDLNN